jgi:predicted CoA-binding protein
MGENMGNKTTLVVGASPKKERYSNKALHMLKEYGHEVIAVHPAMDEIDGVPVKRRIEDVDQDIHTVTLYVGPARSEAMQDAIVALRPERVIFNPGAECEPLKSRLEKEGIGYEEACTLVLLRTGQY